MGKIIVVGVGYEIGQLTLDAIDALRSGAQVILHTGRCGCAQWLEKENIAYSTLDALYESCEDFDEHAQAAAEAVVNAGKTADVVYAVFDVRDRSVAALMELDKNVRVIAGPPAEGALFARAKGSVQMLEASDWESYALSSARSALIRELDSRELASEVKLKLMEIYPDETAVYVLFGDGGVAFTELYNLDRMKGYDHRTCVLVTAEPDLMHLERYDFDRFVEIVSVLLGPDGCPWDRAQTHVSLRPYIIEEAYEVVGAIDEDDPFHLYDELGDMLLQVVLHAQIAKQYGEFDIGDVITAISEKMIHRHSHIFGDDRVADAGAVADLWSRNKMAERGQTTFTESMKDVSRSLPAALRASKILKRLENACGRKETIESTVRNAKIAVEGLALAENKEAAMGEALLRLVDVARAAGVDCEIALNTASDRLIDRFEKVEKQLLKAGNCFEKTSEELLQKYWDLVKLSDSGNNRQETPE